MNLLSVKNLSKSYRGIEAVKPMDYLFTAGRCIALIGPNGAGKTTVLRMLAGSLKPTTGKIDFKEQTIKDDFRQWIGYLPQYPVFYSWMSGKEFLVYSGRLAKLTKKEAADRADKLLDKVGLGDVKNRRIGKYSGGMKQRLGIAQAIIHEPKILLLDEPVSSLDPIGRREVLELMEELKEQMTILFSTHILSDADEVCDELILLHQGNLVESGFIETLRAKYQTKKMVITFPTDAEIYKEAIDQLLQTNCYTEKNVLHVPLVDEEEARKKILEKALSENWPIQGFSINQTSLEDLFMKAVNDTCNG